MTVTTLLQPATPISPIPYNTMTKTGMTKKTVKKKTVKKLEKSDSLNPVIGKMEQEVLKKKQKFKVEEKNE